MPPLPPPPPPTKPSTCTIFKGYCDVHIFRNWRTPKNSAPTGMSTRGETAFLLSFHVIVCLVLFSELC